MMLKACPALFFIAILIQEVSTSPVPSPTVEECVSFLKKWMPPQDKELLSDDFIENNVFYALQARSWSPWASEVPIDIFLNEVLPYASMNERRDNWRQAFFQSLQPLVKSEKSIKAAAEILSAKIWDFFNVRFVPGMTPAILSPYETLNAGKASCTGMSILLVDSLRAVGVPARITGTPEWNNGVGGNHNWVEVWFDGAWSFMDAFDGRQFNSTWFFPYPVKDQIPHSGYHSVYSVSFKATNDTVEFPLVWDTDVHWVHSVDVTNNYLEKESVEVMIH